MEPNFSSQGYGTKRTIYDLSDNYIEKRKNTMIGSGRDIDIIVCYVGNSSNALRICFYTSLLYSHSYVGICTVTVWLHVTANNHQFLSYGVSWILLCIIRCILIALFDPQV